MLEGEHFSYDGIKSSDMGLLNVKIDGGMFQETFLPSRDIHEQSVTGRDKPYLNRVSRNPLEFELTFAFEHGYDEKHIREVARWLDQDFYKPFYTISNENRIFYCMPSGDSTLVHTGEGQGYFTITMRCDSAYSYSRQRLVENIPFSFDHKVLTLNNSATEILNKGTVNTLSVEDSKIKIAMANVNWSMLSDKKWSDFND